ncbi:glycerate kinase [Orrella sp. 11846]|uniref:glycerate kinase n=1 Tax=Orrella sp. 11846 TaxID=3409913 RepID=UPI003B5A737E
MKIIIAPDSFKESLSAQEVAQAIARGIHQEIPHAQITMLPMADGGEGTLDALAQTLQGELRHANVVDALGRPCQAKWLRFAHDSAMIEMASAAGLDQLEPQDRNVLIANTYGVGLLILQALDTGVREITLTAGGSATNDAGIGMLYALGMRFLDAQNTELTPTPQNLSKIAALDLSAMDSRITDVQWRIITDVSNPLCGPQGASAIFGPQKGATPTQVDALDASLGHFAKLTAQHRGHDFSTQPGAGAAGGFAFAALAWLNAELQAGASWIADQIRLDDYLSQADLVITGEGRLDAQTAQGKAPLEVILRARSKRVPVIAMAGTLGVGYQDLYQHGLLAAYSLVNGPMTLEQALANASKLLEAQARDVIRTFTYSAIALSGRRSDE